MINTKGRPVASVFRTVPPRVVEWVACMVLAMASLGLVLWQVPNHQTVSPIDEYVYIDYLAKVPTQLVVHRGEETGAYSRTYLACHGVRTIGYYPEPMCTNPAPSQESRLPNGGATTADLYTPLYFGVTRAIAQPLVWLGIADLTDAGRIAGWTWLAASAILFYLALRKWRAPFVVSFGASLLMVGSLPAYWSNTYVSTDATALFAGALMFLSATAVVQRSRFSTTLFMMSAILVSLLKLQNLMAVGAAALFVILVAAFHARLSSSTGHSRLAGVARDPRFRTALIGGGAAVAAQGIWVMIRSAIAVGPLPDQGVSAPFGKYAFFQEVFKFIPGVGVGALDPDAFGLGASIAAALMTGAILVGVFGLLATSRKGSDLEALAISGVAVALIAGPVLAITNIIISGYYFSLPARYGMSLIPFFLASTALLCARKPWVGYLVALVGVTSYIAVVLIPEPG